MLCNIKSNLTSTVCYIIKICYAFNHYFTNYIKQLVFRRMLPELTFICGYRIYFNELIENVYALQA